MHGSFFASTRSLEKTLHLEPQYRLASLVNSSSMIQTKTRIQYASGYIELGMYDDASNELEAIEGEDRTSAEVMIVSIVLISTQNNGNSWKPPRGSLPSRSPRIPLVRLIRPMALRFQGKFEEAKEVCLKGLDLHQKNGALWYNLACYHSLAGSQGMPQQSDKH